MWFSVLIGFLASYLLGNLNGAVSMSVLQGKEDVRTHGSGNAGLTNFVRNYGKAQAGFVILIDVSKAVLACFVGQLLLSPYGYTREGTMLGAVAVSLGHDFPALLGFRGGKGILCGLAVATVLDYRCALLLLAVFAVVFFTSHYVSLASVVSAVAFSVFFAVVYYTQPFLMAGGIFIGALAIFMHRSNILRLCKGTENKVNLGRK